MLKLICRSLEATPAMVDLTPFLPGLSPVQGKTVVARFDGGRLSSEGGLLALREIDAGWAWRTDWRTAWWTRGRRRGSCIAWRRSSGSAC